MINNSEKETVWELRRITGRGLIDCKNALEKNGWDIKKAEKYLKKNNLFLWY